jgi:hypothetical protein
MTFSVYNFLLEAWNESGKVACQKKPQEDGWGGEGGKTFNIGGEVG